MTGTYTTAPTSRGRFGRETHRRQHWRLHSLQRIPFAPTFYYGVREDTGELVQVHEHGLVFDPVKAPDETLAEPAPKQEPAENAS